MEIIQCKECVGGTSQDQTTGNDPDGGTANEFKEMFTFLGVKMKLILLCNGFWHQRAYFFFFFFGACHIYFFYIYYLYIYIIYYSAAAVSFSKTCLNCNLNPCMVSNFFPFPFEESSRAFNYNGFNFVVSTKITLHRLWFRFPYCPFVT